MIVTQIFTFESAHRLENYNGQCANLHGHSYVLHVSIKGKIGPEGFVQDFYDIERVVNEIVISKLDHAFLNDILTPPTAENIVIWVWSQLKNKLNLHKLKLYETATSYVSYKGD